MDGPTASRDNVVKDDDSGYTYIPASRRPDGSWRKARRVKDGFVPQEEMPTYENKGVQWLKSKPSLPPGLSLPDSNSTPSTPSTAGMSKSAKTNLKRKEKKKQQSDAKELAKSLEKVQIFAPKAANRSQSGAETNEADKQKEQFKHLRALRKKLKQIDDIKERIESGQLKNPEKGQLDKLTKRDGVVSEIEELESELGNSS